MILNVVLRCPHCAQEWLGAQIDPESWWGKSLTPETCAKQVGCRFCGARGPMQVARTEEQPMPTEEIANG